MTRRIILAILVSVWLMMLAAGVTTYFVTRAILLQELDARLVARAAALPEVNGRTGTTPDPTDRYLVRGEHGQVLRRGEPNAIQQTPNVLSAQFARLGDGHWYRSVTVAFRTAAATQSGSDVMTVVYSGSAETFDRVMRHLAFALAALGFVGGTTAAAVAAAASRAALKPLDEVSDVIGEIDEHNLGRRVDTTRLPNELQGVGERLNAMLSRIDTYAQQRRRFLADVSHELRTPVAALVTTLEVNLAFRQSDPARMRRALETCLLDAQLLKTLVARLTTQVRGELKPELNTWQEIEFSDFLKECQAVAEGLALDKGLQVSSDSPHRLRIRTQPDRLRRICLNLIGNAVSYNVPNGRLVVRWGTDSGDLWIAVSDTGVGISAEALPHVFEPFYRADPSRENTDGHLGLGLSQVQDDVAALTGRCEVDSEVGRGTTVRVTLKECVVSTEVSGSPAVAHRRENREDGR